jgi:ribonucrease Y
VTTAPVLLLVGMVVGVVIGFVTAGVMRRRQLDREGVAATTAAASVMAEAEAKAREIIVGAKDEALQHRDEVERDAKRRRRELDEEQARLAERREKLDRRFDQAENRARKIEQQERSLDQREAHLTTAESRLLSELERVAAMTRDDAHKELLAQVVDEVRPDAARIAREMEMEARELGEERAREIIVTCIQRCASDVVSDVVATAVPLPSDEMKGRIIGRQGRNIRAFEQVTGVDVIVDDTPEAVLLSCFDPVRREVGRLSLLALIEDGRIHPARIEQVVKKTQEEVERTIAEAGKNAAFEAGVHGLHKEMVRLLGRLKYRTSYGQNVLAHSVETAHLAAMLAAEVGADVEVARAAGLLHDIGKAVSHEVEGPHALIGGDLAERYGLPPRVSQAIAAHHHELDYEAIEAVLVETADAISGSRPGARRESLDLYLKRIKALENVANAFDGVQETYAIQAGREIRILVRPETIDDLAATQLSRAIARKLEETLEYPGQIKVTVIREMRAVEFAR